MLKNRPQPKSYSLFIMHLFLVLISGLLQKTFANELKTEIKFGVIGERKNQPDFDYQLYGKFHAYLSQKLAEKGIGMAPLVINQTMQEMEDAIIANSVNMLMEGLAPSLLFAQNTGLIKPDLLAWRKGQREYHSVFFVRKDSGILSLEDLPGHSIAFESIRSTSAFQIPLAILRQHKIKSLPSTPQNLPSNVHYLFAGSELNQIYWVHRGKVDAAAFNNGDWERIPKKIREDFQIIYQSRAMLRWLISFRHDMATNVKNTIIDILLHMHEDPQGIEALQSPSAISRFEVLNTNDHSNLEYWQQVINH